MLTIIILITLNISNNKELNQQVVMLILHHSIKLMSLNTTPLIAEIHQRIDRELNNLQWILKKILD